MGDMSLVGTRPPTLDEWEQYKPHHRASEHNKLMKCIEEKGLLISEYQPGIQPDKYRFPRRNRLIGSWSDKLFVIEAGRGSGALITAEYSRKYGREVEMM